MKKVLRFMVALPALALLGCGGVPEEKTPSNEALQKIVGKDYYLSTVEYSGTDKVNNPDRTDFKLTVRTNDSLAGRILCNGFAVDAKWEKDNVILLSNFNKGKSSCAKPDPLLLEAEMYYEISGTKLIFMDSNRSWKATFVQEN